VLLVIDTATPACSVALIEGDEVLAQSHEVVGRGHAERLLPMIENLLDGRRPDAILVDCGPGSFTGVRVGLAAAQGLRIGWQVPLGAYSSMSILAAAAAPGEDVAVALHGGHGQIFVQSFVHGPLRTAGPLRSLLPEEAAAAIAEEQVIGSAAQELVRLRGHGRATDCLPCAADARLLPPALRALPAKPIYGRAPDAKATA
jgi:tRNA threonylcarbamoyladenosine biosynthesis protein TsaB